MSKQILWLTLLLIIVYVIVVIVGRERFVSQSDSTVYATQRLNYDIWVRKLTDGSFDTRSLPLSDWSVILDTLKLNKRLPKQYLDGIKSTSILLDPLDETYVGMNISADRKKAPEGYFVVLGDPVKTLNIDCSIDFFGKRIGWFDVSDYYLLKAFANGYRIPPSSIELVKLSLLDIEKIPKLLELGGKKGGLDYVITYIIPNSAYHMVWTTVPVALYGFQNLNIDRIRLYYPFVTEKLLDLTTVFTKEDRSSKLMVNKEANSQPVLAMTQGLHIMTGKGLPVPIIESFISSFISTEDAYDTSYRCYGDPRIENKAECNSAYDPIGLPKRFYMTWDKPCVRNTDCPYYQANKNYSNTRGGCLKGGVCEMPVGTQRIAYQKLREENEFQPFCYGCDNLNDAQCCKTQEKPDYAFPNDIIERDRAKLTTILSMT